MRRVVSLVCALWMLSVGSLVPSSCFSHALDPSVLVLEESASGRVHLFWSGSNAFVAGTTWDLGPDCRQLSPPAASLDSVSGSTTLSTIFECGQKGVEPRGSVAGRPLRGLASIEGQTLVLRYRYQSVDSWQVRALLVRDGSVDLPVSDASVMENLRRFTLLGLSHIATGVDHLLFVSCLLLLFRSFRTLLQVITSFTIGHSVTLALCTFDVLRFPSGWIESCIALSLLFMARELLLPEQRRGSIYRYPWIMTLLFGFIHGMGFAGALREIQIPQEHLMVSLLGFNLGVELGQILFVVVTLTTIFVVRKIIELFRSRISWSAVSNAPLVASNYAIGIVAAFWFWQRLHGSLLS